MICLEAITILVSGHSLFLNNDFLNLGEHADFPQSPWHRLPELDLVEGLGLFEVLRVLSNNFICFLTVLRDTLALHSSTAASCHHFGNFPWHVLFHFTGLESAIDLLLDKWLPNEKFLSHNG
jgi:hypothetical protein